MPNSAHLKIWNFWLLNPASVFVLPVRQLTHMPRPPGCHRLYTLYRNMQTAVGIDTLMGVYTLCTPLWEYIHTGI